MVGHTSRLAFVFSILSFVTLGCVGSDSSTHNATPVSSISADSNRINLQTTDVSLNSVNSQRALITESDDFIFSYLASVSSLVDPVDSTALQATNFALSDPYAYVVYNLQGEEVRGGLDIVDLSDVNDPVLLASYIFSDFEAADIVLDGDYAYIAGASSVTQGGALIVVDISNPQSISVVQSIQTEGFYAVHLDFRANEDRLLVTSGENGGVSIFDTSTPSALVELSSYSIDNAISSIYLNSRSSRFVVLGGDDSSELQLWREGEDSSSLNLEVSANSSLAPAKMVKQGNLLFSSTTESGFRVLELGSVYNDDLREVSSLDLDGTGNGMDVLNQFAFLAQGEEGLQVVNLENPLAPEYLGYIDFDADAGSANQVRVAEFGGSNLLFLADGLGGFKIVDYSVEADDSVPTGITVYARGTNYKGWPNMRVRVAGSVLENISVDSNDLAAYEVDLGGGGISSGDEIRVEFTNDKWGGTTDTDRNLCVSHIVVGGQLFYPTVNNYPQARDGWDEICMYWNGRLVFTYQ